MDYMVWVWLGFIVLAGLTEAATMQIASVWFIGGGIFAMIVALLGGPLWLQIILLILVSSVLLIFTRPIVVDKLKVGAHKTNADSLIGETCIVTDSIDNIKSEGQVEIKGLPWTARSTDEDITIKKGSRVEVVDIQGVKLIVKKEEK